MNEQQFIAQLLGEGSLTIGGFLLLMGWLLTRRATVELDHARSMAREAIDAYKARTKTLETGTHSIVIKGPVEVVDRAHRSGEHHHVL